MTEPAVEPTPNPPAAEPAAPTPTPAAEPTATPWTEGLNDSHKLLVETKQFKDPASVLDSYVNLEKLLGAPRDKLLQIPASDDKDGMANLYNKLGRPQDSKDYEIAMPEGMENEDFTEWARESFHEAGLTADQVKDVMEDYGEYAQEQAQEAEAAYQAEVKLQEGKLRLEWGAAYDQNVKISQGAVEQFKITPEQIDVLERAMGFDETMRFFNTLGTKVGEHSFASGDQATGGVMTPNMAQAKITEMILDKGFQAKMKGGDVAAKNEWDQLHQWAYPAAPKTS